MKRMILILMLLIASPSWSAQEWDKSIPCKTGVGSCGSADQRADFPADQQANNAALDRVLANYRQGMTLSYSSATTVAVSAGEVVCSNSDGSVRKMRQNTSSTNVTFSDIDTGSEAPSTTYYIYANCDADATTATLKISASSTSPTGVTYYKRIGSFYNDSSSNIQGIYNDNDRKSLGSWESKSVNTTYQASSDGFVVAYVVYSGGSGGQVSVYTDGTTPPSILRAQDTTASANYHASVSCPIKKGDYWKVSSSQSPTIFWIPNEN